MSDFVTQAGPLRDLTERELANLFTPAGLLTDADIPAGLAEPMRYAILGGGKRLRPVLCLAACQALRGDPAPALPAALAIELLHNYTLVHDDLPCMDNDEYRRGRLTVHAKYGYGKAVLVGDALQAAAFEAVLKSGSAPAASELARMAGPAGVVGGQWVDVTAEPPHDAARVDYVHTHKTGDLIACSLVMGAILGGGDAAAVNAFRTFGYALGKAFQIIDDILDADDPAKADELSILRVLPKDAAVAEATRITEEGLAALDSLPSTDDSAAATARALLRALAESQIARKI